MVDGTFQVGKESLWDGDDPGLVYIGTALVDGHRMLVLQLTGGGHVLHTPPGVNAATVTWPANLSEITVIAETSPACFLPGTLIATPDGARAVEDLAPPGDLALTADGRAVPLVRLGRQTVSTRFGPAERLMPVRIRAGALGVGLPRVSSARLVPTAIGIRLSGVITA